MIPPQPAAAEEAVTLAALIEEIRLLRTEIRALAERMRDGTEVPGVLDLDAAATWLRVSRRTVERWIAAGKLHAVKLTAGQQGSVRLARSELERLLEQRTRR